MDIALYIVALIALLVLIWFLIATMQSIKSAVKAIERSDAAIQAAKVSFEQVAGDISTLKTHLIPAIDGITEVTESISGMSEGLKPRVQAIYHTVDDALDVAHGVLEDVERIKDEVVGLVEKPVLALRSTSDGVFSTVLKGVNVIRDLIDRFKK